MKLESFKPKNKRKIVLRDGYNKSVFVGMLVVVVVLGALFTSKMWLGDDREKLTKNTDTIYFAMNDIKINSYMVDVENNVGEIKFTETIKSKKEKYDLIFSVYDENDTKLPFNIIDGNYIKESEDAVIEKRNRIIQFGVPKDYHYIKVKIEQKDQSTQEIILDYRDVKNGFVLEKGKDFLIELDVLKAERDEISISLKEVKDSIKVLTDEQAEIDKLEKSEKESKKTRLVEIELALAELRVTEDEISQQFTEIDTKIKSME